MDRMCTGDPDLFFDVDREPEAKAMCAGCPFAEGCRDQARANREEFGVFGGEDPAERMFWLRSQSLINVDRLNRVMAERGYTPEAVQTLIEQRDSDKQASRDRKRDLVLRLVQVERLSLAKTAQRLGMSKSGVKHIMTALREAGRVA